MTAKFVAFVLALTTMFKMVDLFAIELSLDPKDCHHIDFEDIKATEYTYDKQNKVLSAKVNQSSSILVIPFKSIESIKQVHFEWKASGKLPSVELAKLKEKEGDDAVLRVGLLLHGEPPMFSFTAPAWLKKVSNILKHPSDKLLYLVAGPKQGLSWTSPYSDTIEQIAVATKPGKDLWQLSEHAFKDPMKAVGVWIIADGDNSKVSFQTDLKNLKLN
ncbi:MAG: DUF3047 domain-containing protein [Oligoflexales bacterium]|nr:DUF3047 domain-containing protein [Oligoflexales bacterium]